MSEPAQPVLLVQQTSADCYMDPSVKETFKMNPDDPTAKCYMNLDPLEDADAKFDGVSFLFMTKWALGSVRWRCHTSILLCGQRDTVVRS